MANIIKLGSLLLDGTHIEPCSEYQPGQIIEFANGNDVPWVIANGLLIASWRLLYNISWNDLNEQSLVFGKRISINGQQFLCRLLKVGANVNAPNEWDAALDIVGAADSLWEWRKAFCWGQENSASYRALRGCGAARRWYFVAPDIRRLNYGYRPVLELLPTEHRNFGNRICAIGGQSILYGTLVDVTDYDMIILSEPTSMMAKADNGKLYSKLQNRMVVIDYHQMIVQTIEGE